MSQATAPEPASTPPPAEARFRWPMRLFLAVMLFEIVFRSLSVLVPWVHWGRELNVPRAPEVSLPTRARMAELRAGAAPGGPDPVAAEAARALRSLGDFF